jgi:hypothetical protein
MGSVAPSARTMARFSSCYRSRWDRSGGSSALGANAHAGRTRRDLTGYCFRLVDSTDSQRARADCSTVSREVVRHGGHCLYRASEADQQAWQSALRPRPCLLALHRKLQTIVASKLILDWSPEQISGWLKRRYPHNKGLRVSHETIYRSLFIQARGVLKKELVQHLRSKRLIRRSRHARAGGKSQGQIVDAISIRERPAEIEDRAIPGHWEGGLLSGTSPPRHSNRRPPLRPLAIFPPPAASWRTFRPPHPASTSAAAPLLFPSSPLLSPP